MKSENQYLEEPSLEPEPNRSIGQLEHDLRTHLAILKGYLDMLGGGKLGPISNRESTAIGFCNQSLERLIRISLRLAELSEGRRF